VRNFVTSSNRCAGHAFVGERAIEVQRYEPGVRFSLLLGVGCRPGDCYIELYEGENVDSEKYAAYLRDIVIPHCGQERFFVWDNLSAHLTAQVQAVCANAGHHQLRRPPYSPHIAPIENINGVIQNYLKKFQFLMNAGNLRRYLRLAINLAVTPANVRAIFEQCGY
jgi:transposase